MNLVCYGNSNTFGYEPCAPFGGRYPANVRWVDRLAARTGWRVQNYGQNGREIPRGAVDLPPDTDLLLVMLGTNDLLRGASVAEVNARMQHFLNALAIEKNKLMLLAPPVLQRGSWVPDDALVQASAQLVQAYRALAAQLGIRFASVADWGVGLTFDGVHFTPQGHAAFAEGLYKALMQVYNVR